MRRQDFVIADYILQVAAFLTHLNGPLSFKKEYGDTDIVDGLLQEDFTVTAPLEEKDAHGDDDVASGSSDDDDL